MWSLPAMLRLFTHRNNHDADMRWLDAEEQRQIEEVRLRLERVKLQLEAMARRHHHERA